MTVSTSSLNMIIKVVLVLGITLALSGCQLRLFKRKPVITQPVVVECQAEDTVCQNVQTPDQDTIRPVPRKKMATARDGFVQGVSADKLDETSVQQKEAALDTKDTSEEKKLGKTIASLGDVAEQGFWLKTPLVLQSTEGRIVWADNGNSVNVTLVPRQAEASAGSQISLAAIRALGIPLTGLPELIVFSK